MIGNILLCIIIADFITGLVHFLEDTYGLPTWPLIGKQVIEPNIDHHLNPSVIGRMTNFISRNYQTVIPSAIVGFVLAHYECYYTLFIILLASFGNEIHAWNHRSKNHPIIQFLQNTCIVQTRRNHLRHHIAPYDKYFCTLTNFTNEVLECINFWRWLEWAIAICGVNPKRGTPERRGV